MIYVQVWSQGKTHALYLWIHLKPEANAKEVAKATANLQKYVDQVTDPSMRDEEDEIWAGVGYGPNFFAQVSVSGTPFGSEIVKLFIYHGSLIKA